MNLPLKQILLLSVLSLIISCKINETNNDQTAKKTDEEKTITSPNLKTTNRKKKNQVSESKKLAIEFNKRLKNKQSVSSLMDKNWTLIYHEDNRCTGATDGQKSNLSNIQIDTNITLNVKNNSDDAWACEKKAPYNYDLNFNLNKQIEKWDRFELETNEYSDNSTEEGDVFDIHGAGESDYIKIYFGENKRITKLKYSSEDPG